MVYVVSHEGNPLMPTYRHNKVSKLLDERKAVVISNNPFTIQLLYQTETEVTQPITLGIDAGYQKVGYSAITDQEELIGGELELLHGMKKRIADAAMYRGQRRGRLRHREPRFDNRARDEGWLAPSIQHKLDSHIRLIEKVLGLMPVTSIIIEVASFDTQLLKNPGIRGKEYQQGELMDFWNTREYVLHRDKHKCQNPDCTNKSEQPTLETHHIIYRRNNGSDAHWNLVTLCSKCHTPQAHDTWLKDWKPKYKGFKAETFMSMVRWKLIELLSEYNVTHTYGYETKVKRLALGLDKTHANDAFVIAGGTTQARCKQINFAQRRRNNRCLEKWYDAKYTDNRTGKPEKAAILNNGRRTRNKNKTKPEDNLKVFRGEKLSKGRRSIRKQRYPYQPGDKVLFEGKRYTVTGAHCKGKSVILKETGKSVAGSKLTHLSYGKGMVAV